MASHLKKLFILSILVSVLIPCSLFAQTVEEIKIGVFADMTGQTSSFGQATYNGIKLAVDEINGAGGINGKKLKIYLEDNGGRPDASRDAVTKFIEEDKIDVILGEVASSNTLAAAPVAQEAGIPMISPSATNPKVTEVGEFIFRTCFIDPTQGEAMAKFAFNELKARRVAILFDDNSDYSKGLMNNFIETFTRLGGKIVRKESYNQSDPEFSEQLTKIQEAKADAIYLPGYYGQTGIIAKQAREMRMLMPLLGGDGWDSPELWNLGGEALKNTYITNHFAVDNPSLEVQSFIERYKTEFKSKPDSLAALAYDSVYFVADAIRRAKTTEGSALRDAIARTRNFAGVTGKISELTLYRNAVKPVIIQKLDPKSRQFVYYSNVMP